VETQCQLTNSDELEEVLQWRDQIRESGPSAAAEAATALQ